MLITRLLNRNKSLKLYQGPKVNWLVVWYIPNCHNWTIIFSFRKKLKTCYLPDGCKPNEIRSDLASNVYRVMWSIKECLGMDNRWIRLTRKFLSCDVPERRIIAIFSKHTHAVACRSFGRLQFRLWGEVIREFKLSWIFSIMTRYANSY